MGKILQLIKAVWGNAVWDGIKSMWKQRNAGAAAVTALLLGIVARIRSLSWPSTILLTLICSVVAYVLLGWLYSWCLIQLKRVRKIDLLDSTGKQVPLEKRLEHRGREKSNENLTVRLPLTGKSREELEFEKFKRDQMATHLGHLERRRKDITQMGPELYESKFGGKEDSESRSAILSAAESVRFALGDAEAELFRNDAGFPRAGRNAQYFKYDQMLINLEKYELRLRENIETFE